MAIYKKVFILWNITIPTSIGQTSSTRINNTTWIWQKSAHSSHYSDWNV